MAYFEKFWNCPACGRTDISALRKLKCPSCGHPKSDQDEEKFTMQEITDEEGIELAKGGPHWVCDACGSKNLDKVTSCSGCGTPKGADGNTSFKVTDYGTVNPTEAINHTDDGSSSMDKSIPNHTETASNAFGESQKKHIVKRSLLFWILGLVAVFTALSIFIFSTAEYSATVAKVSWQRSIEIENYNRYHESGWTKNSDAYNVTSSTKLQGHRDVYRTETKTVTENETRYRDNGNGSTESYTVPVTRTVTEQVFDHSEPIYATWYEYDVDKWHYARTENSEGSDKNPYWSKVELIDVEGDYGDEREGSRKEVYSVFFEADIRNKLKTFSKNYSYDLWQIYNVGDIYTIKVNRLGNIVGEPVK